MKNMKKAGAAVLMLLAVLALTSCSMVFYGGLSGKVMDEDNNGIGDVRVFLYLDKGQWEADRALYQPGKSYDPKNFHKDTYTLENGTYAFDKIMWETGSSEFGTVADISEAYLIFYADDWGMDYQTVRILSESKNTASPQILTKKTETFTYRISLVDSEDTEKAAPSRYTVTYSYNGKPGKDDEIFTKDISVEGSELIIPVEYYKGAGVPDLVLSDLECTVTEKKMVDGDMKDVPVWQKNDAQSLTFKATKKTEQSFDLLMDGLKKETFTYRINFKNAGDMEKDAPSRYTFKYSYDGKPDTVGTYTSEAVTVTGSVAEITVSYYAGCEIPTITLSEIESVSTKTHEGKEVAQWKLKDGAVTEISAGTEKTEKTAYVPMVEMWWQMPGFSGEVITKEGDPVKNAKITLNDGTTDIVKDRSLRTEYDNGVLIRAYFSNLGAETVIWRTTEPETDLLSKEFTIKTAVKGNAIVFAPVNITVDSAHPEVFGHIVIEGN